MSEVYNNMYLAEDNVAVLRDIVKRKQMRPIKFADGSMKVDLFTASAVTQALDKVNDANREKITKLINTGKKNAFISIAKVVMKSENNPLEEALEELDLDEKKLEDSTPDELRALLNTANKLLRTNKGNATVIKRIGQIKKLMRAEEVDLDEAKYDLYHKDFSTAMQHAYKMAKKLHGITIDPKEIDDKVASGPSKPSEGKTNSYRLKGDRGAIQVQVYNKGGNKPFELNFYKEEVDLDEAVKVGDNIKVKLRRKGREYIEKGEVIKIEGASIIVKHDFSRTPSIVKMTDIVKEEVDLDEKADLKKINTDQLEKQLGLLKIGKPTSRMKDTAKRIRDELKSRGIKAEEVDLDEASARADAMRAMRKGKEIDPADIDTDASDDDVKAASKNIIMQLRKSISLRGDMKVEFGDKKKVKVSAKIAQSVQNKYNSLKRPAEKEKFQTQIAKSYKDLLKAIKEETVKESKFSLINKQLKGEK